MSIWGKERKTICNSKGIAIEAHLSILIFAQDTESGQRWKRYHGYEKAISLL